jgi:hypothetical protein
MLMFIVGGCVGWFLASCFGAAVIGRAMRNRDTQIPRG